MALGRANCPAQHRGFHLLPRLQNTQNPARRRREAARPRIRPRRLFWHRRPVRDGEKALARLAKHGLKEKQFITLQLRTHTPSSPGLDERFGQEYRDYMATTGRFIPRIGR